MTTYLKRLALSAPPWVLFTAISYAQLYLSMAARGRADGLLFGFLVSDLTSNYLYWWLITPPIIALAARFRFDQGRWRRAAGVHLIAALLLALVPEMIRTTAVRAVNPSTRMAPWWLNVRVNLGNRYGYEVTTYVAVCAIVVTLDLLRRSRDRETHAARLETELVQSRLRALSTQLHPHFLFNALNSIAMLIRDGAQDRALRTVVAYGELLRHLMDTAALEVPFREEIAFVKRYLEVEQTRFSDVLSSMISVPDELNDALVPSLLLQPIVENALHHAFTDANLNAVLRLSAARCGDMLRVEVVDNGVGFPAGWSVETSRGLGLRNTRTRLAECYGTNQRLEVQPAPGGGTRVVIEIPYHIDSAAAVKA